MMRMVESGARKGKADERMSADDSSRPGTAAMPMEILLSEVQIQERVAVLAREIDRDYAGRIPVLVGVLTGACIFMADLVRKMQGPVEMDFMAISSYGAG